MDSNWGRAQLLKLAGDRFEPTERDQPVAA
jgi:hypothetical protein